MAPQGKMLTACIEWLEDWVADLPPMIDEYDLETWMESEGCEAILLFLHTAFRKNKTRQEVLEIVRALVWEWFLFQKEKALESLPNGAEVVARVLSAPQTPQKTAEWYAEARDLLTGHEFAAVVYGTPAAQTAAIAKKCVPPAEAVESRIVYTSPLSPFQWGWRYEPVIRSLYETEVAKGRVDDSLGRIRHPILPRLAASPDGVILEGPKAGRLLEIKAPKTRILTGQIPQEYYCQMQLQAEVTGAPAVEYVEVRFEAQDASWFTEETRDGFLKSKIPLMGTVLVVGTPDAPETWQYAYSPTVPLNTEGLDQCLCWKPEMEGEILERSIWRIEDWWTTTVPRNQRWWLEVGKPAYEFFWEAVDNARVNKSYTTCLIVDEEE